MKIPNGDIWLAREAVQGIAKLPPEALTVRGKYTIAKLARVLGTHFQDMETARVKLIQQFGQKTETGYEVRGPSVQHFQTSFAEILDVVEDVDWTPVALAEKDVVALTVGDLLALDKFLTLAEPLSEQSPNGDSKEPLPVVR